MIELLKDWKGQIKIGDICVDPSTIDFNELSTDAHIILQGRQENTNMGVVSGQNETIQYRVTVKKYMTEPSSPTFDFMAKWNNNIPMPLRMMTGVIEKETRGMVYMRLHGQAEPVIRCMRCGRTLTNPVSQHYGIGPECISKLGFVCDIDDVETIKKKLVDVVWAGWVIKSAILEQEEV